MTPAALDNSQQPFDFNRASCWTMAEIATRHDPRCVAAFRKWRAHRARIMRAAAHQRDLIRAFSSIFEMVGASRVRPDGTGPAIGIATQETGAVIVIRRHSQWIGRAVPTGTFSVSHETVAAAYEVAPWTRS